MQRFAISIAIFFLFCSALGVDSEPTQLKGSICGNNPSCFKFMEAGNCKLNPDIMAQHCSDFCDKCKGEITTKRAGRTTIAVNNRDFSCLDNIDDCVQLAAAGECEKHPEFGKTWCSDTCGHCNYDNLCVDRNNTCAELARNGDCTNNSAFMIENCPESCGKCGEDGFCLDRKKTCPQLAEKGDCETNALFMTQQCPLSCGKCGSDGLCLDKNKKCTELARAGQCDKNSTYMMEYCPAACGKCGTNGFCLDKSKNCFDLVSNDGCKTNSTHIPNKCPQSCKTCNAGCLCRDLNKNCAELAASGHCQRNRTFMESHCPLSCGYCSTGVGQETRFCEIYNWKSQPDFKLGILPDGVVVIQNFGDGPSQSFSFGDMSFGSTLCLLMKTNIGKTRYCLGDHGVTDVDGQDIVTATTQNLQKWIFFEENYEDKNYKMIKNLSTGRCIAYSRKWMSPTKKPRMMPCSANVDWSTLYVQVY